MFKEFAELTIENTKSFEYIVTKIILEFVENFPDKALEFPKNVDSSGRVIIHDVCN